MVGGKKQLTDIKKSLFRSACKSAVIENFTFPDLQQNCINNWNLWEHDFSRIKADRGHKPTEMFKRYNTVTDEDLQNLASESTDNNIDTSRL